MSVSCKVDKDTMVDIDRAVHILVGGSTGSGKSYLMKNMLCDMLLCDEYARFLVIDPKSVDYQFLTNNRDLQSIGRGDQTLDIKRSWRERGIQLMDRDSIDNLDVVRYLKTLVKDMYSRYNFMKRKGYVDWNEVGDGEYDDMWRWYQNNSSSR